MDLPARAAAASNGVQLSAAHQLLSADSRGSMIVLLQPLLPRRRTCLNGQRSGMHPAHACTPLLADRNNIARAASQ